MFIKKKSKYAKMYLLHHKSQVVEKFTHFKKEVETQTIKKIKILSSNNGTRFQSNDFNIFLSKKWYK
jgi:hypothetical protein